MASELTAARIEEISGFRDLQNITAVRELLDHITALEQKIKALVSNLHDAEGRYEACYAELVKVQKQLCESLERSAGVCQPTGGEK